MSEPGEMYVIAIIIVVFSLALLHLFKRVLRRVGAKIPDSIHQAFTIISYVACYFAIGAYFCPIVGYVVRDIRPLLTTGQAFTSPPVEPGTMQVVCVWFTGLIGAIIGYGKGRDVARVETTERAKKKAL